MSFSAEILIASTQKNFFCLSCDSENEFFIANEQHRQLTVWSDRSLSTG